jgi:hypothetical protein
MAMALQVLEQVLMAPKKTRLHDKSLSVLALHTSPLIPLPRTNMLSVSFFSCFQVDTKLNLNPGTLIV